MAEPATRRFVIAVPVVLAIVLALAPLPASGAAAPPPSSAAVASQEPEPQRPPQDPEEHGVVEEGGELSGVDLHAEEEEHAEEPKPWFYWPAKWFNFIALLAFLYWVLVVPPAPVRDIFSFPGLKVVLGERAAAIVAARDLAAQRKEEAARLLTESEQRLAKIEREVEALVTDARSDADNEKVRAREDGNAQAARIIELADREVQNERIAAQRGLRRFVADLAISMAEANLEEHLTADDQDRLIRDYLSRLGQNLA